MDIVIDFKERRARMGYDRCKEGSRTEGWRPADKMMVVSCVKYSGLEDIAIFCEHNGEHGKEEHHRNIQTGSRFRVGKARRASLLLAQVGGIVWEQGYIQSTQRACSSS